MVMMVNTTVCKNRCFQGKDLHEVTYPELAKVSLMWIRLGRVLGSAQEAYYRGFTAMAEDLEGLVVVMLSSLVMVLITQLCMVN